MLCSWSGDLFPKSPRRPAQPPTAWSRDNSSEEQEAETGLQLGRSRCRSAPQGSLCARGTAAPPFRDQGTVPIVHTGHSPGEAAAQCAGVLAAQASLPRTAARSQQALLQRHSLDGIVPHEAVHWSLEGAADTLFSWSPPQTSGLVIGGKWMRSASWGQLCDLQTGCVRSDSQATDGQSRLFQPTVKSVRSAHVSPRGREASVKSAPGHSPPQLGSLTFLGGRATARSPATVERVGPHTPGCREEMGHCGRPGDRTGHTVGGTAHTDLSRPHHRSVIR